MKDVYIFALIGLLITLQSCKEKDKSIAGDVLIIDFKQDDNIRLNEILMTDYIKLETNESCFIDKSIIQLACVSDKIFILSGGAERSLYVFDISGNFIGSIGEKGNGPGEFVVPASFSINTESNIFSVVDIAQRKIIDYSLDGFNFISEKVLDYYSSCFEYVDENQLLLKNSDSESSYREWELLLSDYDLNLKNTYIKKALITGYSTGHTKSIYKYEGKVYAYAQYNPIIYSFEKDKMEPVYHLKFGKFDLPPKDYLNRISANYANFLAELDVSDYLYYYCAFETKNMLNVYYSVGQEPYVGFYNKEDSQTYGFSKAFLERELKIGRMDRPSGTINDFTVATLQPFDLRERLDQGYNFDPKLEAFILNSNDDDNPILFLYKFKD